VKYKRDISRVLTSPTGEDYCRDNQCDVLCAHEINIFPFFPAGQRFCDISKIEKKLKDTIAQ
jgi:hypothetical protein